jgi:predicted transcriptional regulator
MVGDPHTKRLLWFIFAGSKGGLNRLKIIKILRDNPMNTNQLANNLGFDYKAIQHHLKILEKNNLIVKSGEKYAVLYFIAPLLEVNLEIFDEIAQKLDKSK